MITRRRHESCVSARRVAASSLLPTIMITMISDSTILGLTIGLGAAVSALIPISPSDGGELLGA